MPPTRGMILHARRHAGPTIVVRELLAVCCASLIVPASARGAEPAADPRVRGSGEPPRVALVVVGSEAKAAGALTRSLEGRLVALPQLRLRTSEQGVAVLAPAGAGDVPASDPLGVRVSEKLPMIARAFYDEKLDDALATLTAAEAVKGRSALGRLRLLLWRAAILGAKGDKAGAESAAKEAMALAPDVEADPRTHPPELGELLDGLKTKVGRSASLAVVAYPPGAVVRIDDRLAEGRVALTPGKHLVVVTSRGYRPVEAVVNVTGDATVTLSLPVSYGTSETPLGAYAEAGADLAVAELAKKLEVESVVVVATDPGKSLRANVWGRTPAAPVPAATFTDDAAGQAALADWIEARFKPEIARAPDLRSWTWIATGGPVFAARQRSLGSGREGYDASFGGFGPGISLRASPGRWRVDVDASLVSYALGSFEAAFPDGTTTTVGGGSTTSVRAGGGFAFGSGRSGREDRAEIAPFAAVAWERHEADDVTDERGALGFLPSHERLAIATGIQAGVPLGKLGSGPLRFAARAAVVPASTWRETPNGSSGRDPRPDPGFEGAAALRWEPGRWMLSAQIAGEYRTVGFRGEADLPADPPLRGSRMREGVQVFSLTAGRAF